MKSERCQKGCGEQKAENRTKNVDVKGSSVIHRESAQASDIVLSERYVCPEHVNVREKGNDTGKMRACVQVRVNPAAKDLRELSFVPFDV